MKKPHICGVFLCPYDKDAYICIKLFKMNIKHRLTITMWALPFPFMMVALGNSLEMKGAGVVLIITQCVLWHKLLGEIKEN